MLGLLSSQRKKSQQQQLVEDDHSQASGDEATAPQRTKSSHTIELSAIPFSEISEDIQSLWSKYIATDTKQLNVEINFEDFNTFASHFLHSFADDPNDAISGSPMLWDGILQLTEELIRLLSASIDCQVNGTTIDLFHYIKVSASVINDTDVINSQLQVKPKFHSSTQESTQQQMQAGVVNILQLLSGLLKSRNLVQAFFISSSIDEFRFCHVLIEIAKELLSDVDQMVGQWSDRYDELKKCSSTENTNNSAENDTLIDATIINVNIFIAIETIICNIFSAETGGSGQQVSHELRSKASGVSVYSSYSTTKFNSSIEDLLFNQNIASSQSNSIKISSLPWRVSTFQHFAAPMNVHHRPVQPTFIRKGYFSPLNFPVRDEIVERFSAAANDIKFSKSPPRKSFVSSTQFASPQNLSASPFRHLSSGRSGGDVLNKRSAKSMQLRKDFDTLLFSIVQTIVAVARKVNHFSKVMGRISALYTKKSSKSVQLCEDEEISGDIQVWRLVQGFVNHKIYALQQLLAMFPETLQHFTYCEGSLANFSLLSLSDIQDFELTVNVIGAKDTDLLTQRCKTILLCHAACLDASILTGDHVSVSVTNLQAAISRLCPILTLLHFRSEREFAEYVQMNAEKVGSLSTWKVECKCPVALLVKLPETDYYPWSQSRSSSAMHFNRMNTCDDEQSCSSLTSLFRHYWKERCNSFPTHPSQVFLPEKSFIYDILNADFDWSKASVFNSTRTGQLSSQENEKKGSNVKDSKVEGNGDGNKKKIASGFGLAFLVGFSTLPAASLLHDLFAHLHAMVWKYAEMQNCLPDRMILFKDTLKVCNESIESVLDRETNSTILQLMYVLFLAKAIQSAPHRTILTCRSHEIWKALFNVSRISRASDTGQYGEKTSLPVNQKNKFLDMKVRKRASADTEDSSKPLFQNLSYELSWTLNDNTVPSSAQASDIIVTSQSLPSPTQLHAHGMVRSLSSKQLAAADTILSSKDSGDSNEAFSTQRISHGSLTSLDRISIKSEDMMMHGYIGNGTLSPGNSRPVSLRSTYGVNILSPTHETATDAEANNTASAIRPNVGQDGIAGTAATDDASNEEISFERKWEFIQFFQHYFVKDMVLDLMRICAQYSYLSNASDNSSFDAKLFHEYEAAELVETLSIDLSDDAILLILKWLSDLIDFHNKVCMRSLIWGNVMKKCLSISKNLVDSAKRYGLTYAAFGGNNDRSDEEVLQQMINIYQQRPLFWPLRAAVLQLAGKIAYSSIGTEWLHAFFPRSRTLPLPEEQSKVSVIKKSQRAPPQEALWMGSGEDNRLKSPHSARRSVLLLLLGDPLCREYAASIIIKVLDSIALEMSSTAATKRENEIVDSKKLARFNILEALGHDILKGLLIMISSAPPQPISPFDWCYSIRFTLQALVVLLRNPSSLCDSSSVVSAEGQSSTAQQQLFFRYGIMTQSHVLYGWNQHRPNLFKELLSNLSILFKKAYKWPATLKMSISSSAVALMTAVMHNHPPSRESFQRLMLQKTRRKTSSMRVLSNVSGTFCYHDLLMMMIGGNEAVDVTPHLVLLIFTILLDGLPIEFRESKYFHEIVKGEVPDICIKNGFFVDLPEVPYIINFAAMPLLLNIICYCNTAIQQSVLMTIVHIVAGGDGHCIINFSKCCQFDLQIFGIVLDVLPCLAEPAFPCASKLLQKLGSQVVNVSQLKRLFRMLQPLPDGSCPKFALHLLQAMSGMVQLKKVPRYFFYFEGRSSGLRLPAFKKWPAPKGFALSIWFSVVLPRLPDHQSSVSTLDGNYSPRLMCMRQDSGVGFEVTFVPIDDTANTFSVTYIVYTTRQSVSVKIGEIARSNLGMAEWNHLIVSHTCSGLRSKSEITVLLNGVKSQHIITFPRFTDEVKYPIIGDASPPFRKEGIITSLCGHVSTIYFFSEPLGEAHCQVIYELGPTYAQTFSEKDAVDDLESDSACGSIESSNIHGRMYSRYATDGVLNAALMLVYYPGVRKGNVIIDSTPERNANLWKPSQASGDHFRGYDLHDTSGTRKHMKDSSESTEYSFAADMKRRMHALCLSGTHICTHQDIRDSIDCLGGIKVLFPLFHNLPSSIDLNVMNESQKEASNEIFSMTVRLLFSLIQESPQNYHFVVEQSGFGLLSYLMDNLGPLYWTNSMVSLLIDGYENISNPTWQDSMMNTVFCNIKLWRFTGFSIQRRILEYLQSYSFAYPDRARSTLTVSRLLDALYYVYTSNHKLRMSLHRQKHDEPIPFARWVEFNPISETEIKALRSYLVHIIYIMLSKSTESTVDDLGRMLNYISHESNPLYKVEIMQILLQMISPEKFELGQRVLRAMTLKNGMLNLLVLLRDARVRVRLYGLLCMCSCIQFACQYGNLPYSTFNAAVSESKMKSPRHADLGGALNTFSGEDSNADSRSARSFHTDGFESSSSTPSRSMLSLSRKSQPRPLSNLTTSTIFENSTGRDNLFFNTQNDELFGIGNTDIFTSLGMGSPHDMELFFLEIQSSLHSQLQVIEKETMDKQCYIIFAALFLTMIGYPSKALLIEVEKIRLFYSSESSGAAEERPSGNGHRGSSLFEWDDAEIKDISVEARDHFTRNSQTFDEIHGFLAVDEILETIADLSSALLCVPAIAPALLSIIRWDFISLPCKLKMFERLQAVHHLFDNIECFAALNCWAYHLLQLVAAERVSMLNNLDSKQRDAKREHQDSFLTAKYNNYSPFRMGIPNLDPMARQQEINDHALLLARIFNLFSKTIVHCVLYGAPPSGNRFLRPGKGRVRDFCTIQAKELLELLNGDGRRIGCLVLKEVVALIRTFASEGHFDGRLVGRELLQRVVDNLRDENEQVTTAFYVHRKGTDTESENMTKKKILEVNVWIVTSMVLDFVSFPPIQQAHSSLSRNSINADDIKRLVAAVHDYDGAPSGEAGSASLRSYSEDFTSSLHHQIASSDDNRLEVSDSMRVSFEESDTSLRNGKKRSSFGTLGAILPNELRPQPILASHTYMGRDASPQPLRTSIRSPILKTAPAVAHDEFYRLGHDKRRLEERNSAGDELVQLWQLVSSTLDMLGPLSDKNTVTAALDLTEMLKIWSKVGIRLGRGTRNVLNESVNMLIRPLSAATSSVNVTKNSLTGSKDPLVRAVDGTMWMILRALLKIFLEASASEAESPSMNAALESLMRLTAMLDWVKSSSKFYYETETNLLVSSLVEKLLSHRGHGNQKWEDEALRCLYYLIAPQREKFLALCRQKMTCENVTLQQTDDTLNNGDTTGRVLSVSRGDHSEEEFDAFDDPAITHTRIKAGGEVATPRRGGQFSSIDFDEMRNDSAEVRLMTTINAALGFEDDENTSANSHRISLREWHDMTQPVLLAAQEKIDELLAEKLTELGLHRDTELVRKMVESLVENEVAYGECMTRKLEEFYGRIQSYEPKRFREIIRSEEMKRKKFRISSTALVQELGNERGPWGRGVLQAASVLWVIDPCEDNFRMKLKLTHGPCPRDYLETFMLQNGAKQSSNANEYESASLLTDTASQSKAVFSSPPIDGENPLHNSTTGTFVEPASSFSYSGTRNLVSVDTAGSVPFPFLEDSNRFTSSSEISRNHSIVQEVLRYRQEHLKPKEEDNEAEIQDEDSDEEILASDIDERESRMSIQSRDSLTTAGVSGGLSSTLGRSGIVDTIVAAAKIDNRDKVIFKAPCQVVLPSTNSTMKATSGMLELTRQRLTFTANAEHMNHQQREEPFTASNTTNDMNRQRRAESVACEQLWICQPFPSTSWETVEICNVLQRYFQLRFVAVEIFLSNRRTVFFNLLEQKIAQKFQSVIRRDVRPPHIAPYFGRRPMTIISRATAPGSLSNLTIAWTNREISNFDYLMRLNMIAGRTYNDLSQYPIFPWILADYTSEKLDLRDRKNFRDLRWPMGAQDPAQREMLNSKYRELTQQYDACMEMLGDDEEGLATIMPPFHYGTHYSVAGFVLWFLMRVEPYTSLHVQLQDGHIDRPDRLFDSLDAAFRGCISNPSDVKELVPELFYNPEVLLNRNDVDFGITQGKKQLGDIVLPPWAKNAHDFIRKHRDALESEYVSLNLHHWIDLIFGYKQRPPFLPNGSQAAVDACNVYYYLTYEDSVDLDALRASDPVLYQQYMCQIAEFGQTPCQLFTKPHSARSPLHKVDIIWPVASVVRGVDSIPSGSEAPPKPKKIVSFKEQAVSVWPILFIAEGVSGVSTMVNSRLITVDCSRVCGYHQWTVQAPDVVPPFKLKVDQSAYDASSGQSGGFNSLINFSSYTSGSSNREKLIGVPFAPAMQIGGSSPVTGSKPVLTNYSDAVIEENTSLSSDVQMPSRRGSGTAQSISTAGDSKGRSSAKVIMYERVDNNARFGRKQQPQQQTQSIVPVRSANAITQLNLSAISNNISTISSARQREREQSSDTDRSHQATELSSSRPTEPHFVRFPSVDTTEGFNSTAASEVATNVTETPTRIRTQSDTNLQIYSPASGQMYNLSIPSSENIPAMMMIPTAPSADGLIDDRASAGRYRSITTNIKSGGTVQRPSMFFGNRKSVHDPHLSAQQFAYSPELRALFSCGHWDRTCRVTAVENGCLVQSVRQHRDIVTCVALAKDFGQHWLATGSRDCTIMVWKVHVEREIQPLDSRPLFTLYGHDDSVTSLVINPELDVVVSGSDDSTIILHNLRDGSYIRSIADLGLYAMHSNDSSLQQGPSYVPSKPILSRGSSAPSENNLERSVQNIFNERAEVSQSYFAHTEQSQTGDLSNSGKIAAATPMIDTMPTHRRRISWIGLSKEGCIVTYSADDHTLSTFSLNGQLIVVKTVPEALYAFILSEDGKVVITGGSGGLVVFRWVHNLELAKDGPRAGLEAVLDGSMPENGIAAFDAPIRSLMLTRLERHLVVGLESGAVRVLAQDSDYLRQRLQNKLVEIGILGSAFM